MSLLIALPSVYCQDTRTSTENHLRVLQSLLFRIQHSHLGSDRDVQVQMQLVDQAIDQVLVFLQKRSIVSPLSNSLRTSQVQVHRIAIRLHDLRGRQQRVRIVCAELDEQRTIDLRVSIQMRFRSRTQCLLLLVVCRRWQDDRVLKWLEVFAPVCGFF